jgi:phage terminase large subunit-like protein
MLLAAIEGGVELDDVLACLSTHEAAALAYDWRDWWARPKQRVDLSRPWRSHGFLAGRRFGKSRCNAEIVIELVQAGRAPIVGLMAQTDQETERIMIKGEAGLLACSPPWFPATYESGEVTWPNGSKAIVFTPQRPGNIRGDGVHLMWMMELQSWPVAKRQRALENALAMCSLGEARVLWDATSKRRHPLLGQMIRDAEAHPEEHTVIRGHITENRLCLSQAAISDLIRKHARRGPNGEILRDEAGNPLLTQRGREELEGEYTLDDEGALWRDTWIVQRTPDSIVETVVSIDPAITAEAGSDETGIVVAGLDSDGRFVVLDDRTAKMRWEAWGDLAIDLYLARRSTCMIVERNRGGDAVVANVRARAMLRDLRVVVLERKRRSRPKKHDPRVIYVREVIAYDSKWNRAEPVAGLYEAQMAYHDERAALGELEHIMTTWEPAPGVRSPNALDALTHAASELMDLEGRDPPKAVAVKGAAALQRAASSAVSRQRGASPLARIRGSGRGSRL